MSDKPLRPEALAARIRALEHTEAELAHRVEGLRLAIRGAHVGIWDDEFETGHAAWSDSLRELYGVGPEVEATFENFLSFVHPDDRERIRSEVAQSTATGEAFEYEYRFIRPSGEQRWLLSRGRVLLDENGEPGRRVGAAIDITRRKQSEEQRDKWQHRQVRRRENLLPGR